MRTVQRDYLKGAGLDDLSDNLAVFNNKFIELLLRVAFLIWIFILYGLSSVATTVKQGLPHLLYCAVILVFTKNIRRVGDTCNIMVEADYFCGDCPPHAMER